MTPQRFPLPASRMPGSRTYRWLAAFATAMLVAAIATPADAGGYGGWGYKHRPHHHRGGYSRWYGGYGYSRYGHHHGSSLSLGFIFAPPPRPVYVATPPPRVVYVTPAPAARDCKPTTGTGVAPNGRAALYGGTWCYDRYGTGYVVAGSEYFIRYLN